MVWYHLVAYLFGGFFLCNAIPHFVAGSMGRPFQSPFANPTGEGLSSSRVNVVWGAFNLAVAYVLFAHVGEFDIKNWQHVAPAFAAMLICALFLAGHMGRFYDGNDPQKAQAELFAKRK